MTSCWSLIHFPQRKLLGTSRRASVLSWSRSRSEPVTDPQSSSIIYDTADLHATNSCSRNLMLTCVTLIYWSHYIWYSWLTKSHMHWTGKRPFGSTMVLRLLRFSSALERMDHGNLLDRPRNHFGVSGQVLMWSGGFQCFFSCQERVPQGSVLSPLSFSLYLAPLGQISRCFWLLQLLSRRTCLELVFSSILLHLSETEMTFIRWAKRRQP